MFGVRGSPRLWNRSEPRGRQDGDQIPLVLFAISTVWFLLHTLVEFRNLTGDTTRGWLDIGTLIVFLYPPVIMQTVYREAACDQQPLPPRIYRHLLTAMFVISPLAGVVTVASIFELIVPPVDIGAMIGVSIGTLFILASIYSTAIMLRRRRPTPTPNQARLRTVMIGLYISLGTVFVALLFLQEQRLLVASLDRVARSSPIYFLIASIYFENRFEFYDLVVKRGLLILLSVIVLGTFFAGTLPWLVELPGGAARPGLFAVALVPVAMIMPWLHARLERWLDRMWLGREFTPVDAVKHVLAAMQPATDERSLVEAAESKLSEIFGTRIAVLIGDQQPRDSLPITAEVSMPSPVSGEAVRIAVLKVAGSRRILSEDLALLKSLAGVFGFMFENLRLQRKRLTCTIDSDHLAPAPHVPSMLLQTLLENAVTHGVSQSREPGRIDVIVRTASDQVTIEVRNTGPGASAPGRGQREGEGFGLHSVRERLKGHFGDGATFALTRDDVAGVTIARITMPNVRVTA